MPALRGARWITMRDDGIVGLGLIQAEVPLNRENYVFIINQ